MQAYDFEPQATLNPKLWEARGKLKNSVRGALLRIARDFVKYTEVEFPIIDIVITGSMVNYNYGPHSDLDLHIITDYADTDCDRELEELFDVKRLRYEQQRPVTIYGIPVTLYVEDQGHPGVSQGLYSVKQDRWINRPQRVNPRIDTEAVRTEIAAWEIILSAVLERRQLDLSQSTLKLLRSYRKLGLASTQGEYSTANIVYKHLRNHKLTELLHDQVEHLITQSLSLD